MAKKSGAKGGSPLGNPQSLTSEQKQKVQLLHEQLPECTKEFVTAVLHFCNFDQEEAMNAFTFDGGVSAYKSWTSSENNQIKANNKNKKKNKKKNRKENGILNSNTATGTDPEDSSSLHSSNIDFDGDKESSLKLDDCEETFLPEKTIESRNSCEMSAANASEDVEAADEDCISTSEILPDDDSRLDSCSIPNVPETQVSNEVDHQNEMENIEKNTATASSPTTKDRSEENLRYSSQKHFHRQRHGSFNQSRSSISDDASSHSSQANKNINKMASIKCWKDLKRQSVSLQRVEQSLGTKLNEASKCLKNTFSEIHKLLDKRHAELEEQMEKSKTEAWALLISRQDLAEELKVKLEKGSSLDDAECAELKADIKQFVTERKYDDELGKTIWYHWSMDGITEEIKKFGEVTPVKNAYSQRSRQTHSPVSNDSMPVNADDEHKTEDAALNELSNEAVKDKTEQETHTKVPTMSDCHTRVFSNTRYTQQHYSGHPNYNNRGRGFRGRRNFNRYQPRGRYNYQHYSEDRYNNDHRHYNNDRSENQVSNMNEGNQPASHTAMHNQEPRKFYDRRSGGGQRRGRVAYQYGRNRFPNRTPKSDMESVPSAVESADTNANYDETQSTENKDMVNGF